VPARVSWGRRPAADGRERVAVGPQHRYADRANAGLVLLVGQGVTLLPHDVDLLGELLPGGDRVRPGRVERVDLVPLAGYISDQVGRVPVFRFGAIVLSVLAFPGWYLISLGNPVLVILVIGGSDSA
jgi:hypothetical protein